MQDSRRVSVQCDSSRILGGRIVGCRLPNLIAASIEGEFALLGIKNFKIGTPERLHKGANEDVNALDRLLPARLVLLLQVGLDVLAEVLVGVLAVLELGKVQRVVAGDVAGHPFGPAGVDEALLALDHERRVAEVAADDHVAAPGKLPQLVGLGGLALDDGDVGRGA